MPQLLLGDLDLLADPYMAKVGSSWGEWVAITTTTDSLFLDGSVVSGEQSGNRTIAVQVMVRADPRPSLVRACELLFAEANKQANTLTFVPDEGQRVVYDVFRAQPERTDDESEAWGYRTYTFTFPALPFARSDRRVSTGALAPAITLVDFESPTTGILAGAGSRPDPGPGSEWGMPYDTSLAESSWVQVARAPSLSADTNCTVVNSTTVSTPRGNANAAKVTATAAGLVEAHVTAAAATSATAVVAGANVYWSGSTRHFQAGIEWLDASNATVRVDWGDPQVGRNAGNAYSASATFEAGTVWVAAARPSTATQARLRLRVPNGVSGDVYPVIGGAIVPLTPGTLPTTTPAHDGTKAVSLPTFSMDPKTSDTGYVHPANPQGYGYLRVPLAAPVDISAKPVLQTWAYAYYKDFGASDSASVQISDASGRWSRFDSPTIGARGADNWQSVTWSLGSPSQTSTAGPADLTAVSAVSVSVIREWNGGPVVLDGVQAVNQPTATTSPRGTVFALDVVGSARSTARVALSAGTAMTDFVVAAVDASESPLLKVAGSVATAPAPACYDGVYSVIGAVAPATALTSPSCVVAQLVNGTQVATQTLTGLQVAGNHYVDFGQVALPLVAVPAENMSVSYTFTLTPSSTAWAEVLVINAAAPLTWVQSLSTARGYAWVDEPVLPAQVGRIFVGAAPDRTDARAVLSPPVQARPFQVAAPAVRLLVYSTTTAPNVTLDYYPRWLVEPDG